MSNSRFPLLMLAGISAIGLSCGAFAEDQPRPWDVEVDLGVINTSGNTETTSMQGKIDAKQNLEHWKNQYILSGLYKQDQVENDMGEKSKETTAEKYFASLKSSYPLDANQDNDKSYMFGYGSYTNDKFGAYRTYTTLSLGYGDWLYSTDTVQWFVEGGPGYYRGEKPDADNPDVYITESGAMLRAATELVWKINDNAEFKQELSVEAGSDNTRTISETSLSTTITDAMKMKVGVNVANNSKASADKEKTDTTTFVNLVYSF